MTGTLAGIALEFGCHRRAATFHVEHRRARLAHAPTAAPVMAHRA
jgi:hypothetical protein